RLVEGLIWPFSLHLDALCSRLPTRWSSSKAVCCGAYVASWHWAAIWNVRIHGESWRVSGLCRRPTQSKRGTVFSHCLGITSHGRSHGNRYRPTRALEWVHEKILFICTRASHDEHRKCFGSDLSGADDHHRYRVSTRRAQ